MLYSYEYGCDSILLSSGIQYVPYGSTKNAVDRAGSAGFEPFPAQFRPNLYWAVREVRFGTSTRTCTVHRSTVSYKYEYDIYIFMAVPPWPYRTCRCSAR